MNEQIKKYFCGKVIFHSGSGMFFIQDDPKVGDKHIADIRGWGNIQYLFPKPEGGLDFDKAAEFQDTIGEFIAEAINEKLAESHIGNVMSPRFDEEIEKLKDMKWDSEYDYAQMLEWVENLKAIGNFTSKDKWSITNWGIRSE